MFGTILTVCLAVPRVACWAAWWDPEKAERRGFQWVEPMAQRMAEYCATNNQQ